MIFGLKPLPATLRANAFHAGLLGAAVLFAFSLTPTLIPRTALFQGAVSGISIALGYGAGHAAWRTIQFLLAPRRIEPGRWARRLALIFAIPVIVVPLWLWPGWENDLRQIMGMPPIGPLSLVAMLSFSCVIAAICIAAGAWVVWLARRCQKLLARRLPPRIARLLGVGSALLLAWLLVSGIIVRGAMHLADSSYREWDQIVQTDRPPPTEPDRTGSRASLIEWNSLGRTGRDYIASGPTRAQIEALTGHPARQPLRVYAGLTSADTPEQRADLALRELIRVGGFDRRILVVIAPTGTGWVDGASIDSLEYLQGGDVASIAVQYSYLASWLSLLAEPDNGTDTARALFRRVLAHWKTLPHDKRPKLFLFGLSLGALASENALDLFDLIDDPIDGALLAGPPFPSPLWRFATAQRDPASPAWLPRFGDGSVVRFASQNRRLDDPHLRWGPVRIGYLQYGSDPITFFETRSWYRRPEWLAAPRAPDVSRHMHWIPVITFLQLAIDMAAGTMTPPGFGHVIACEDYADAWSALTDAPALPPGRKAALCAAHKGE